MENQEKVTAFFNAPMVGLSTYVVEHYRELGMTNDEFLLMVHLLTQMTRFDGDVQLQMVANQLGWSVEGVSRGIEQLREKEYLTDHAKRDGNGKVATQLDFSPLYMKILAFDVDALPIISTSARVVTQGENALEQLDKESNLSRADIFNMVEQEFGRPLSPMEINTIKNWFDIDHFRADFIQVAIQEAVLNGALSLRYIETILASWQKKNYHSLQDVYAEKQKHQQFKQREATDLPDISWDVDIMNTDWTKY
ncbi:DnaD domain-containing protein [Weissella tructae]|uniref:DnaD protein n=2 Tax=Weissella TaxID=46255 RepID=A0A075TZ75_9LACO|nr:MULTISPECIES: DnaD domain protein [Weissella]AIG65550.1 DnaD protein [Weissella tructae]AIM62864.1 DnaD protein [Weissella ceti]ELA06990.1 DNA replication protein DnaD [Weissella ceti NC36]QVV91922.1 DnaD domain protein [Weissella tructae]